MSVRIYFREFLHEYTFLLALSRNEDESNKNVDLLKRFGYKHVNTIKYRLAILVE